MKRSRLSSVLSSSLAGGQGTGCLICSAFIIYLLRILNQLKWGKGPSLAIPFVGKVMRNKHSRLWSHNNRMRMFTDGELCSFTYSKEICVRICILLIIVCKIIATQIIVGWKLYAKSSMGFCIKGSIYANVIQKHIKRHHVT